MAKSRSLIHAIIFGIIFLVSSTALGRASDDRQYNLPFKPHWVTRLKKGKIFKYRRMEFSSPQADEDSLYVGTDSARFYAIKRRNGHKRWSFKTQGAIESKPTINGEALYFGDSKGIFYAVNRRSGDELWRYEKAGSEIVSAPTIFQDRIYLTTLDGRLIKLDLKTGQELWTVSTNLPLSQKFTVRGSSQPLVHGGRVYAGFPDGTLKVFKEENGALLWEYNLAEGQGPFFDVDTKPLIDEQGHLYVASFQGKVVSLSLDGMRHWEQNIGTGVDMVLDGERLYVSSTDGRVVALNRKSGATIWESKIGGGALTSVSRYHDTLIVGSSEKLIYFLNAHNGEVMAYRFAKKGIISHPVLADDEIYFLSNGGLVYALRLRDQKKK